MPQSQYDPASTVLRAAGIAITKDVFLELLCSEFSPHRQRTQEELLKFAPRIISSLNQNDRDNLLTLIARLDAGSAVPPQDSSEYMQAEFSRQIEAGITNCGSDFERYPRDAVNMQGQRDFLYQSVSRALIEAGNKILPPIKACALATSNYENPPQHLIPFE